MVSPRLTQSFSAARGESTRYIRVLEISKTGKDPFKEYLHSFSFSKLQKYMVTFFKEIFFCGISTSPLPTKQTDYSLYMYISHIFLFLVYLPRIWVKSKKGKNRTGARAGGSTHCLLRVLCTSGSKGSFQITVYAFTGQST